MLARRMFDDCSARGLVDRGASAREFQSREIMAENKSFADVFDSLLSDWKKFLSFLLMLCCLAGLILISFVAMNRYSGSTIKEINLSATGSKVLFEAKSPGGKRQFLLVVHPQGWQNTGIHINRGSQISFKADGRVNVDGAGLFKTVIYRKDLEEKKKEAFHLDGKLSDEAQTPEYHFSDEEKKNVMLQRPWVDPDGFAQNTTDERIPGLTYGNRVERLELKGENLGCLIGRIGDQSNGSQLFKVGKKQEIIAQASGDLWLNVNDVRNLQSDLPQEMFYLDNVGFFWVVVTTEPD